MEYQAKKFAFGRTFSRSPCEIPPVQKIPKECSVSDSCFTRDNACACSDYFKNSATYATSKDNEVRNSVNKSRAEFSLKLTIKNLL